MNDKLAKQQESQLPTKSFKVGMPKLHQKVAAAEAQKADVATLENRIGLLLDCSGSMGEYESGKSKIAHLNDALTGFVAGCDFTNTAVACETFPSHEGMSLPLSSNSIALTMALMGLQAGGGTPMAEAMEKMLNLPITRAVMMSDGESNHSLPTPLEVAEKYREATIPIDCIHIGSSDRGEDVLVNIAEKTGGIYMKFTDVASFAKAFKFLTPSGRATLALMDDNEAARMLGADEVRK